MQTSTLGIVVALLGLGLVCAAYYTNRIRWYVAVPLVVVVVFTVGAFQASAHADVRVRWSAYDGQCYRYSVTEHRTGLSGGLLGDLWHLNQRLNWCQIPTGGRVFYGPIVHRSRGTNALWEWGGYQAKTHVRRLDNPRRWRVYVKGAFSSAPNVFGVAEHNYPWIRMTIYKANPTHVHYTASCGC